MKKIFIILTSAVLALSALTACSGATKNSSSASTAGESTAGESNISSTASQTEKKSFTVGLIQLVEHPSLDEIRTSFETQIAAQAKAQDVEVTIDYQNAQGEMSLINSICRQFVDSKVDAIVAIATPAAQGAATATSDIPIIFSAVTDPVAAGLLDDLNAPGGNITGTSDAIAVEKIFELAFELTPDVKKFGFIYNKGEPNSVSVIEQAKEYLKGKNVEFEEKTVTVAGEVQQASRVLLEGCDAVFTPIDNTVASAMGVLADEAINVKKPVYTAADSMVNDGGLATVGISYVKLGNQTADMALRILMGAKISETPVEVLTEPMVVVNETTAKAIGVDVSKYAT